MKKRILTIAGVLALVAALATPLVASVGLAADGADTSNNFSDFAIVGDSWVIIGNGADVVPGSGEARVGSNGTLQLGTNGKIGDDTDGGNAQSLGDMTLGNGSKVYGDATTGGTLKLGTNGLIDGLANAGGATTMILGNGSNVSGDAKTSGDLKLGTNGLIGGSADAGVDMTIGNGAKVLGDADAGGTITKGTNAKIFGTEGNSPEAPDAAPTINLPECPVTAPGGADLTTGTNTSHTVSPGDYGNYVFGNGNTVVFETGEYSFQSLRFGTNTKIEMQTPVTIHIANGLIFGNGVKETLANGTNLPEDLVYRLAEGASAQAGTNSRIYGTFCGPMADVVLGNGSWLEGAVYADTVRVGTNGQIISSPADLEGTPVVDLSMFVLLASPGASPAITLGSNTLVYSGDVGTDGSLTTGTYVDIDADDDPGTTSRVVARTIGAIGSQSTLDELYTDSNPVTVGTYVKIDEPPVAFSDSLTSPFAAGNLPDPSTWPTAGPCSCGTTDITLGTYSTATIDAGAYDAITIGSHSTITLTGGTYQVRSLTFGTYCDIHVQAPTTICVGEMLTIASQSVVNDPAFGAGEFVAPEDFIIEYAGSGTATMGTYVKFYGAILAYPDGSLTFASQGKYHGAYIAKAIVVGTYVEFWLDSPY